MQLSRKTSYIFFIVACHGCCIHWSGCWNWLFLQLVLRLHHTPEKWHNVHSGNHDYPMSLAYETSSSKPNTLEEKVGWCWCKIHITSNQLKVVKTCISPFDDNDDCLTKHEVHTVKTDFFEHKRPKIVLKHRLPEMRFSGFSACLFRKQLLPICNPNTFQYMCMVCC